MTFKLKLIIYAIAFISCACWYAHTTHTVESEFKALYSVAYQDIAFDATLESLEAKMAGTKRTIYRKDIKRKNKYVVRY